MVTVTDIIHDADAYRRAYPQFGRTQTVSTPESGTCWADPLSRKERRLVGEFLARACKRFYNTPAGTSGAMHSQIVASAEMADLHLDVTERAEVPARARP